MRTFRSRRGDASLFALESGKVVARIGRRIHHRLVLGRSTLCLGQRHEGSHQEARGKLHEDGMGSMYQAGGSETHPKEFTMCISFTGEDVLPEESMWKR